MNRAVLDFIGFPVGAPGNLERRLRRATYLADGSVLDDGSRTSIKQTGCQRLVLLPGCDIETEVARAAAIQVAEGYAPPDTTLLHVVAKHERQPKVLASRRLNETAISHRIAVRAVGFDLVGAGEMSIGLARVTSTPHGRTATQKASVLLPAGSDVGVLFDAIDIFADSIGYEPLSSTDLSLLTGVSQHLSKGARITRCAPAKQIEHQRIAADLNNWWTIPVEAAA